MKENTLRLLAFAKEFFISGERDLERNDNTSYMQAVLKFHDAVEYCTRAVIEEFNINHDRNLDLLPLMRCINSYFAEKKLPFASQMDFLNATRGKVKHHASVPSFEDTQRCKINSKEFLEEVTKNYLNTDFASVNRQLLIELPTVREYLDMAIVKKRNGEYLEGLILIKKAFYVARPSENTFISSSSFFSSYSLTHNLQGDRELKEAISKIVDKVHYLEEKITSLMMGVDTLKLRRFNEITPQFIFTYGGTHFIWDETIIPTEEMFNEAFEYVVDMAFLWQKMGVIGNKSNIHNTKYKPNKEIRTEDWHPY